MMEEDLQLSHWTWLCRNSSKKRNHLSRWPICGQKFKNLYSTISINSSVTRHRALWQNETWCLSQVTWQPDERAACHTYPNMVILGIIGSHLTKFCRCHGPQPRLTIWKFCQMRPNNSQNYHIWVGVTSDPFVRQPSDLWQTLNFVSSEGPVMCDWQID